MLVSIRRAQLEDASNIAQLGRQTFVETFVEDFSIPYPPDDLAGFLAKDFDVERHRTRITTTNEGWWVAEHKNTIVGFCTAGSCGLPHPEVRPSHSELRRLYLARSAQGQGLGRRLLETALAWMAEHGDGPEWVGVWSGNLRAQALYRSYGFEKVGEYDYPVGRWLDREHILRRIRSKSA